MDREIVLVTGAKGQLGIDVISYLKQMGYDVYGVGRKELDITDSIKVHEMITMIQPAVVIHCAAHTQVDLAEAEPDEAFRINAFGTRNVAVAAEKIGAKLVYISTDYVFSGLGTRPYHEFEPTQPVTVYGKSKLAGEQLVKQLHSKFFIVRTSWVYGLHGSNFVKTMLKLAGERDQLNVVHDQVGTPTYTLDLAAFIGDLISTELYGTYHASNTGSCSWFEFAKAIFEEAGYLHIQVNPVTTAEFRRQAPRPAYSVMDHMSIRVNGLKDLPPWRESLRTFIQQNKLQRPKF